jgi:catechol 2,3-dioxygenase-like lactoylglutathione lyase family enzyme
VPNDGDTRSLFHININCSDIERSIAFYQALGFTMMRDHLDLPWPKSTGTGLGAPGAQGRACLLTLGDDRYQTQLDLIEWTQPRSPEKKETNAWDLGVPRICLWVRSVERAYEALKAEGVEFISQPIGGHEKSGVRNMVCARDPDGLIVELLEFYPGAKSSNVD